MCQYRNPLESRLEQIKPPLLQGHTYFLDCEKREIAIPHSTSQSRQGGLRFSKMSIHYLIMEAMGYAGNGWLLYAGQIVVERA